MLEPTVEEIIKRLNLVLNGSLTREEVSNWAEYWTRKFMDEQGLSERKLLVWKYLDVVSGIDLKDSPTSYLHTFEDIMEWIQSFKE
ncbi:hypothetical protein CVD25_03345 [Bacillus canaveralius]|uniref:Uncharacterized protein n=1 Tax=Bacillus canaveralius TaxID=1403243 RepID=A0A2N5GSA2_9BACI|nr:hypothetical protein CU635_00940 [Bacillus canaveralius]PLR87854.1 hypothetical protein CVD23_01380 [Bacillus sp. V33-4]PLS00288.1 hypothetical protein CVD25_03345 [Bacillus canaveralius]